MILINKLFIKAFSPNEQLVMLQLLLNADNNGVVEFSDRGIAKLTGIPYQQVRTIHRRLLSDGILNNAPTNAKSVFVTICNYDSYSAINVFSNAVTNAVYNALKDKVITTEKDKVSTETPTQTEKENNKEKEIKEEDTNVSKKKYGFVKPTIEEVSAYIIEKGYHFDAERFHAYYESNGWMVGKNKMKNWKAACKTWEGNRKEEAPSLFDQQPIEPKKSEWE